MRAQWLILFEILSDEELLVWKHLTEHYISAESENHLFPNQKEEQGVHSTILTVFRRPRGLHSMAPMKTPGRAMAPNRSCHSAVFRMELS